MLGESSQCEVRPGVVADAAALSDVFRESWASSYIGIIPHFHLDSIIRRRTPEWWCTTIRSGSEVLVLEVCGKIAGYATLGAARARGRYEGEIYELYILPTYQGLGFGERLFETCRYRLDGRQLNGLLVWALADNTVAADFYRRRGGRQVAASHERFGQVRLKKVAFAWD